jgi:hypothetical protein
LRFEIGSGDCQSITSAETLVTGLAFTARLARKSPFVGMAALYASRTRPSKLALRNGRRGRNMVPAEAARGLGTKI